MPCDSSSVKIQIQTKITENCHRATLDLKQSMIVSSDYWHTVKSSDVLRYLPFGKPSESCNRKHDHQHQNHSSPWSGLTMSKHLWFSKYAKYLLLERLSKHMKWAQPGIILKVLRTTHQLLGPVWRPCDSNRLHYTGDQTSELSWQWHHLSQCYQSGFLALTSSRARSDGGSTLCPRKEWTSFLLLETFTLLLPKTERIW